MLALADLCRYIRAKTDIGEGISAGVFDDKLRRGIGVFDNNQRTGTRMALGGAACTRYYTQNVSVLVHWSETQREAAQKAQEIFGLFYGVSDVHIESAHIAFFAPSAPQSLGLTEDKVYEYVVPVEIYINKEE